MAISATAPQTAAAVPALVCPRTLAGTIASSAMTASMARTVPHSLLMRALLA